MRALQVLGVVAVGVAGVTAAGLTARAPRAALRMEAGVHPRPGADSARVARLLNALAHSDPVVCDLIGDQLGNFWMGEQARLGRFEDAPDVQGAKDSLAGGVTDPRAIAFLQATLGTENVCVCALRIRCPS